MNVLECGGKTSGVSREVQVGNNNGDGAMTTDQWGIGRALAAFDGPTATFKQPSNYSTTSHSSQYLALPAHSLLESLQYYYRFRRHKVHKGAVSMHFAHSSYNRQGRTAYVIHATKLSPESI